jgi:hypothetical protein
MAKRAVKKPRDVIMRRWGVFLHRAKAESLGSLEAKTDKDALELAYERFEIEPYNRFRVAVRRE